MRRFAVVATLTALAAAPALARNNGKSACSSSASMLFLDPVTGDDSMCCTNAQPCKTIDGIQAGKGLTAGTRVMLNGGTYTLSQAIFSAVAGVSGTSTKPVVYQAESGQIPVITGAQPLTGWQPSTIGGCQYHGTPIANCYATTVPAGSNFANFDYLLYLPAGQTLASAALSTIRRTESVSTTVNPPGAWKLIAQEVQASGCPTAMDAYCKDRVAVTTADLLPLAHDLNDIRFYNFRNWNVDALRLKSTLAGFGTHGDETELVFSGSTSAFGFSAGLRYLIVNSLEYFQANATPGTFYLDCGVLGDPCAKQSNIDGANVYYIAQNGENPVEDSVLVPQVSPLIADTNVNYLTFRGIYFVGDNFVPPASGYQSNTGQPYAPAALSFVDTQGVSIDSSVIAHTSGWGLEFTNDSCVAVPPAVCVKTSSSNQLTNSVLYDIGASGLRLGRFPVGPSDGGNSDATATQLTTVKNNLFTGLGRMYPGGEAGCVWIGSSHNNTIQHNECADSYGGGIAVGPAVLGTAFVHDNTIIYNSIHDIGEGVIDDFGCVHFANQGGALYRTGAGDTFQNNICHDITHALGDPVSQIGGVGIYIDQNSQYVNANYNLVYRTSDALFFNNFSPNCAAGLACNNTLNNNILAYSYRGGVRRGGYPSPAMGDGFLDFTFKHNVVYLDLSAEAGPQDTYNGHSSVYWDCNTVTSPSTFPPPCTNYFNFLSNDYWNPSVTTPLFYTTSPSTTWTGLAQWQTANYPGEDGPDNGGTSQYADPQFAGPGCQNGDNYRFQSGAAVPGEIAFDTAGFAATYTAGRSHPVICNPSSACPAAPTFPLQSLECTSF